MSTLLRRNQGRFAIQATRAVLWVSLVGSASACTVSGSRPAHELDGGGDVDGPDAGDLGPQGPSGDGDDDFDGGTGPIRPPVWPPVRPPLWGADGGTDGGEHEQDPPDGGPVLRPPSDCAMLAGTYQMNTDIFELEQDTCSSLRWSRERDHWGGPAWTHEYVLDGQAHDTKDELSRAVTERASIDLTRMIVERSYGSEASETYAVYLSGTPCDLFWDDGVYLVRETLDANGQRLACDYWWRVGPCPELRAECDSDPRELCEADVSDDPMRCGSCDRVCGSDNTTTSVCEDGKCQLDCSAGFGDCDGQPGNGCERSTTDSTRHCGACGHACGDYRTVEVACVESACEFTCEPGYAHCSGHDSQGCETKISADGYNCGECGNDCLGGACGEGVCQQKGEVLAVLGSRVFGRDVAGPWLDHARVYYGEVHHDDNAMDVYALDKRDGGAPERVVEDVESLVVTRAGTLYYKRKQGSTSLLVRKKRGAASEEVIATGSVIEFMHADEHGVLWSGVGAAGYGVYAVDANASLVRTLHVGDNAFLQAMNQTHAFIWQDSKIHRVARVGGSAELLGDDVGKLVHADAAWLYFLDGGVKRMPVTGGTVSPYYEEYLNGPELVTDGTHLFVGQRNDTWPTDVVRLDGDGAATATPVAYGSMSGLSADEDALYMIDGQRDELRRIPLVHTP